MRFIQLSSLLVSVLFLATSCTKSTDTTASNVTTDSSIYSSVPPQIKIYNVMDYGPIAASVNGTSVGSIYQYYPYGYKAAGLGANQIDMKITNNNKSETLTQIVDLLPQNYYSMFLYRVGYNWKLSLVKDNLSAPPSLTAKIRVLDFRTQAYLDYVNVKVFSPGNSSVDYTNRNFLDHESFDVFNNFNTVNAGTYTIKVYNSTTDLKTFSNISIQAGKIYTFILLTKSNQTSDQALNDIRLQTDFY